MEINIIGVGKVKEKYILDGVAEFIKRIGAYADIKIIEIKEEGYDDNRNGSMKAEEERILETLLKNKGYNILLDLSGSDFSSEKMAEKLNEIMVSGNNRINFIIGGSYGVTENIRGQANLRLRFSQFTFPHQLMRLILAEQIYRWLNILNNGKYHK